MIIYTPGDLKSIISHCVAFIQQLTSWS